jgi:hypothetical protein
MVCAWDGLVLGKRLLKPTRDLLVLVGSAEKEKQQHSQQKKQQSGGGGDHMW